MDYENPSDLVFGNYDLLTLILEQLEDDEFEQCATTNKTWCDITLDRRWQNILPSMLIRPLGLSSNDDDELYAVFKKPVDPHTWERFYSYTKRVRGIVFDVDEVPLSRVVCREIIANAPDGYPAFPNLKNLGIYGIADSVYIKEILNFLHEGVEQVDINLGRTKLFDKSTNLGAELIPNGVVKRAPRIKELSLISGSLDGQISRSALIDALPRMSDLVSIYLDPPLYSTSVLQALSELTHLEEIRVDIDLERSPCGIETYPLIKPRDDQFLNLRRFEWLTTLPDLTKFMVSGSYFPRLEALELFLQGYSISDMKSSLTAIAVACPQLKELYFREHPDKRLPTDAAGPLTIDDLRPLTLFTNLVTFRYGNNNTTSFCLGDAEFADLLGHCPKLVRLGLQSGANSTTLTPAFLPHLAAVKPDMRNMSILIDATSEINIPPSLSKAKFLCLENIDFGYSWSTESDSLISLLADVLPNSCLFGDGSKMYGIITRWYYLSLKVRKLQRQREVLDN